MPREPRTRLAAVDPRLRLLAALAACCISASASSYKTPALLFCFICALLLVQGISVTRALRAVAAVAWIGGLAVLLKLFFTPGAPLFPGFAAFPATREGATLAARLATRLLAAAVVLLWLTSTTAPDEIETALLGLGLPRALVELLSFTRHFIRVLGRTAADARGAAALRSGFSSARTAARSAGVVAGVVAIRMLDRSERVAAAMRLRGYRGALPLGEAPRANRRVDAAFAAAASAALWLCVAAGGAP